MAVRFFTTPKPLSDAMDSLSNTRQSLEPKAKALSSPTSVNGTVSSETPRINGTAAAPAVPGQASTKKSLTFGNQQSLPKLPIPDLESTCRKYVESLAPLQTPSEHEDTKAAVEDFLKTDGPVLQEKLKNYASSKTSYIEQFCKFPCSS